MICILQTVCPTAIFNFPFSTFNFKKLPFGHNMLFDIYKLSALCTSEEKYSAFSVKTLPRKQRMCCPQAAKRIFRVLYSAISVGSLILVQYDVLFLPVFLSRILPNTGDEIQIDNLQFACFLLYDHTAVINFFYQSLYAAVI